MATESVGYIKSEQGYGNESTVPTLPSEVGTRVSDIAKAVGGMPRLAEMTGLSESQLYRYVNGESEMKLGAAVSIARAGGRSVEWLAFGESRGGEYPTADSARAFPAADAHDQATRLGLVLVPRYDVRVSAGGGSLVHSEQVVDHLAFKRDWLRREGLSEAHLILVEATGDSMEPTISRGDLLLVDLSQSVPTDDAIYILRIDSHLVAKRVQRLVTGELRVQSDNPAYALQVITPERVADLCVLGRVVWVAGRV